MHGHLPPTQTERAYNLTQGSARRDAYPDWTADGRTSRPTVTRRMARADIYVMMLTAATWQLTANPADDAYPVSPDGKTHEDCFTSDRDTVLAARIYVLELTPPLSGG